VLNLSGNSSKNLAPEFPYQLRYSPATTELSICTPQPQESPFDPKSLVFLRSILFPKVQKWMANPIVDRADSVRSLQLVNIVDYNQLYANLKEKYGSPMVEIWPEKTDPKKYVYEDIAIAAYLLTFWRQERERINTDRLQSFVDLGCGNGLLVHILASEGHTGYGIDLRKRGIWDMYPATTKLKLESIVPSSRSLFPDIDYIIGNHSDELSPWIPVIAARSSYATKYFLLPCCAFDFDGAKYQRKSCTKSQYNDFLDYVQQISEVCGYRTAVDRLKIPSTKRICVIGDSRTYAEDRFEEYGEAIQAFIDGRCRKEAPGGDGDAWSENFKPREGVEKVRNCTQIEKSVISEIVRLVFDQLIVKRRIMPEFHPTWNCGGAATLSELVRAIPGDLLKQLKAECGGLQTLLKNNHQIFEIQKGTVRLRLPKKLDEKRREFESRATTKEFICKQKECWFLANHPDGCPFAAADCSYKH
jgi:tRNASer (uridine44-2'-O)-methyltransferase